jgi:hypothetical protein
VGGRPVKGAAAPVLAAGGAGVGVAKEALHVAQSGAVVEGGGGGGVARAVRTDPAGDREPARSQAMVANITMSSDLSSRWGRREQAYRPQRNWGTAGRDLGRS